MDPKVFLQMLMTAVQNKASDIHLQTGVVPGFRIKGDILGIKTPPLTDADLQAICKVMVKDPSVIAGLNELKEYDGSYEVPGLARFRYNIFRFQGRLGAILRVIPQIVPNFDQLGLPPVLKQISESARGLVLVTGATGSGKTNTLAAMIDYINASSACHILTIEDPVEFVHPSKRSRVSQRELGRDTGSFANALRAALRQDPDVILVGEMRDPETIDIALKAAETGHLVMSTVHTNDAIKTIGRLVSVFPAETQKMVRMRLAENLVATISQRLLKRADGAGMCVAAEIMVSNKAIQACIADPDRTGEINDFISKSREILGGQTFDQHLAELYSEGKIALEVAKEAATSPSDFERNLMYSAGSSSGKGNSATRSPELNEEAIHLDHSSNEEPPPPTPIDSKQKPNPMARQPGGNDPQPKPQARPTNIKATG